MTRSIKHVKRKRKSDSEPQVGGIGLDLAKKKRKSKILGETKQSKFKWKRDPKQIKWDNPNNIKRKASKHFGNKKEEVLKSKIKYFERNCKNKHIIGLWRGINEFVDIYHPRNNSINDKILSACSSPLYCNKRKSPFFH